MNKMKFYRQELGLSQIELGLAANISRYVVTLCEQGVRAPTEEEKAKISNALGKSSKEVFPNPICVKIK